MRIFLFPLFLGCAPPPLPDSGQATTPEPPTDTGVAPLAAQVTTVIAPTRLTLSETELCAWTPGFPEASCEGLGTLHAPSGGWRDLSLGTDGGCGLTTTGDTVCWGGIAAPSEPLIQIVVLTSAVCGVTTGSSAMCWTTAGDVFDLTTAPVRQLVRIEDNEVCALTLGGDVVCRGFIAINALRNATTTEGPFLHLYGGASWCAVDTDYRAQCGTISLSSETPLWGRIEAAADYFCAQAGEQVLCWNHASPNEEGVLDWGLRASGPVLLTRAGLVQ